MSESDQHQINPASFHQTAISENAFLRVLTLRRAELSAAARMRAGDDYPDFFVEGSGPPWHERWPEAASARTKFSEERMVFIDSMRQDDYPDFFVEGSGPPWHERWPEAASFDPADMSQRVRALTGLNVIQAFINLRSQAGE